MVRGGSTEPSRLPRGEVEMLSLDEILDLGVIVTEEQIDFLHHPENRLAVAVYGIPDPDCLYTSGPEGLSTVYQQAAEGEPANEHGLQAVLLPIVIQGDDQETLARDVDNWMGPIEFDVPVVHGWPHGFDFGYSWAGDESPLTVACWDLWPISSSEVDRWIHAAGNTFDKSALPAMHELLDNYNGNDYYGPRYEEMQEELYQLENKISRLDPQDPGLRALADQLDSIRGNMEDVAEDYIKELEERIHHPVTGEVDAQLPPVHLEPEQAAIWRSLQALSWRNWSTLKKNSGHDSDALYGGRFVEANRRLCPWY